MDINALRAALKAFENPAQHLFQMPASQVPTWSAVQALVANACAAQTLTITGISTFPPDQVTVAVVYVGESALFPWSPPPGARAAAVQAVLSVTATFTVDDAGNPQLFIRAVMPGGLWHLSDSLGGLWGTVFTGVEFDAGRFLLTSVAAADSSYPGPVRPWVNFVGTVALAGAFGRAHVLVPTADSRTIAGRVDLGQGDLPVMTLVPSATRPVHLGGVTLDVGAAVRSWYKVFEGFGEPVTRWPIASAEVVAYLRLGADAPPIRLRMPVLADGSAPVMSLDGGTQPLSGWSDLDGLAGGVNLGALIPGDVPVVRGLTLKGLSLFLDLDDGDGLPTRSAVAFDVALDTSGWAVLPNNIMALNELGARLSVNLKTRGGPTATGVLYGRFSLVEEIHLQATLGLPDLSIAASLDEGTTVSVADVMSQFMQKLTGRVYEPPVDMMIERLDLTASARSRDFQLACDVVTDWSVSLGSYNGGSLITLSFDGISFNLDYDGEVLAGAVSAYTTINSVEFYVTAQTAGGPDAGWTISAGTMPGSRISVLGLLTDFMFPNGAVPGGGYGIPSLDITALDVSVDIDPDNAPVRFRVSGRTEGSWDFQVFEGSTSPRLRLAALLDVEGAKAVGPANRVAAGAEWSISGDVAGTLELFGLTVTAGYQFAPDNSALRFGIWYGERGIEATVTQRPVTSPAIGEPATHTVLTVRLGDLSLGEILEFLVDLAVPGGTRRLPSPWDVLYEINFKNLSLVADLTTNDVEVRYDLNLNLAFARLDAVALVYKTVNGEGRVYLQLYGDFLGLPYGTDGTEPLGWDVISEGAPPIPGKGEGLIDIRYVGIGQHVALSTPDSRLKTVDDVLTAMKAAMKPVSGGGNPLDDPAAASLRYDGDGKWLFGVDATLVETLTIAAVFYDPHIYGAVIELAGDRAGPLSGLRFELVYRRITADIGEFSIDLRIPDQFRNWEFGEVSVTLGIIHVDVYTNGNFRVDAGFPHDQDFSVSFSVQVFPFIGQGGVYFAYLTGATSERVPAATNGGFDPVIEAGVGLAVGVGKEFSKGPLSAALSLELYGIFEGVFAPFHPYDAALPRENYFWFQGTAGVVGKLYGAVDFVVVKAAVSLVARASATVVLESHEPTEVSVHLEVVAEASVTVLYVTVHFSFELTIDESITIGSATAAPWIEGPTGDNKAATMALADFAPSPSTPSQPRLRRQRPQRRQRVLARLRHARTRLTAFRVDPALRAGRTRAALRAGLTASLPGAAGAWPPIPVFGAGTPRTAGLQFVPGFTVADPATLDPPGTPGANQVQVVLMLVAENTIDPAARTAREVSKLATGHIHVVDDTGTAALPLMIEAFFRWAAAAGAQVQGGQTITAVQLQDLLDDLADPAFQQATFSYANLTGFLAESLNLQVLGYPTGTVAPTPTSGTFVPIVPEITAAITIGTLTTTSDFGAAPEVSPEYVANLAAYVRQLATDAAANTAADPFNRPPATVPPPAPASADTNPSLAQLIFSDYFALLTRAAIQAAIDLLSAYPDTYPASGGPSLADLAGQFVGITVPVRLARGQTLAHLAASTGIHPDHLAAVNPGARAGGVVNVPVAVTALSVAQDNATAPLAPGAQFNVAAPHIPGLPYQVRAGQTLNDIAAAAPYQVAPGSNQAGINPPPTGTSVGQANAALPGLLRTGAALSIPSFTYTRLANDTDAFLASFFQVRNGGVDPAPNLDWYGQAVATLNPSVDWASLAAGLLISVPNAYLDSTAAPAQYPVHQGDTLVRIAATFALFEQNGQQYVASSGGGTYNVPAMSHDVASTDTFDSLANDFPGLAAADLIGANVAADVLTPLATLTLPAYGAQVGSDQTLATLAAGFDLTLSDLVDIVSGVGAIFQPNAALTIRDVPAQTVDQLVADIQGTSQVNQVAAQLSRFLMHGLRVPAPDDQTFLGLTPQQVFDGEFTGSLFGLYDLTGQQFTWPDPAQTSVGVSLTKSSASWLTFAATTTADGAASPAPPALNPRLADGPPPAGTVVLTDLVDTLTLTLDSAGFADDLPSTTLTLNAGSPQAMTLYDVLGVHHNLQVTIHWQAAARPPLPGASGNGEQPGEPAVWPFTTDLLGIARGAGGDITAPFGLFAVPLDAPPGTEGVALANYAWAVMVPFAIQRVAATPLPGTPPGPAAQGDAVLGGQWLPRTYVVEGADQAGAALLYDLWVYLQDHADTEAGTRLFLLYPPNATGSNPAGLASDALDDAGASTYLLKTNLSTETRQPTSLARSPDADDPPPPVYSATIGQPAAFVTFLWEATVVRAGGFYLHDQADGAGLPDSIFDDSGRATVNLVCLLGSQSGGSNSGGGLLAVNNCAVVGDNVDAAAVQLYAARTGSDLPTVKLANVPPGNLGFTILRDSPDASLAAGSPAQLTGRLYNLFGFVLEGQAPFAASNEGLPVGPTPLPGGDAGHWFYHQVFDAARRATDDARVAQSCAALPDPAGDPYAGVSATSEARVTFAAHDAFGNQATATDPPPALNMPFRYIDRVIGLGEWPGATAAYSVAPPSGDMTSPSLVVALGLQAANYVPGPGLGTVPALYAASAHALRYQQIFYQINRPGVTFSATTTLDSASADAPLPLSLARFAAFVAAAYVFVDQVAGLTPVRPVTGTGETLGGLAGSYSVTAADLLNANKDLPAARVLSGSVTVPLFGRFKRGQTLNQFAQGAGVSAATLLGLGDNIGAPVPSGVALAVDDRTFHPAAGQTLATMAAAAGCTPGDIGEANATTAGLLADVKTVNVRGVPLVTHGSTFASLVGDYAGRGIMTSAGEIAALNADLPNLFNPDTTTQPVSYVVRSWTVPAPTTVAAVIATQFGGSLSAFLVKNADTPGVVAENSRLQTGTQTEAVPASQTLRDFVERSLGLSMAEFAAANPTAALASGATLLIPALLDPAPLSAVPYAVAAGQSLDDVAALFGTDAATLGTSNQNIAGIFVPGQPVSVGSLGPVTTDAEDSLATLLARFQPPSSRPTLAQLIAAVAPSTTLLQPGATLIGPAPVVPTTATSLDALAALFGYADDVQGFARANASLDGLLDASLSVTLGGQSIAIGAHGTLTSLYARALAAGVSLSFAAMVDTLAGQNLLVAGAKFLLPPRPAAASVALPADPAVTCTITPLSTEVTVARPSDEVDPGFADTPAVAAATTPVPPLASGEPASYAAFAGSLEATYGNRLRVAAGKPGEAVGPRRQQLYAVHFEPPGTPSVNAIERVAVERSPTYFALPPLANELVSRAADIRVYQSGADDPLPAATERRVYQAIDVQSWAGDALAAFDLVLSPAYAAGAFAVTRVGDGSASFDGLVDAKRVLAGKVAAGLVGVLLPATGDPVPARKALEQTLDVSLVEGFATDAVVQLPTASEATFGGLLPACADGGGHRLAGKPRAVAVPLDLATTLDGLAQRYQVDVSAVARLLGATPNLLATGTTLQADGKSWTIGSHDTLRTGVDPLGLGSLDAFAALFRAQAPLFRDGVTVAIDGYSATTGDGSTLADLADALDTGLHDLAVANQSVSGLLAGTLYVNGVPHEVTDATSSLAGMGTALVPPLTVEALAEAIAGQAVLAAGKALYVVRWVPDHSLSAGKIDLDHAAGTLNLLLNVKQRAQYRRLLVNLDFPLTGLEYEIRPAPLTSGYERSDWLQFIRPLDATAATIDTTIGRLDIPVPLRAYPTPPRLVSQLARPTYTDAEIGPAEPPATRLGKAKAWTYLAVFETDEAAQDLVYLKIGLNFTPPPVVGAALAVDDPFAALAEFSANAPAIQSDLANLLLPPAALAADDSKRKAAKSAVEALSVIARNVADHWGPVAPGAPVAGDGDDLIPRESYAFRLETRTRPGASGVNLMEALVLVRTPETLTWGPGGQIPSLGYIDDDGRLRPLLPPQIPPGPVPDELMFTFEQDDVPAYTRRGYAVWYDGLDAAVQQNARMSLWLTRNESLTPGAATDPAFVYRTPEVHFYDVVTPSILRTQSFDIGGGQATGLASAVTALFIDLLGPTPTLAETQQKLALRYGYRVTPGGGPITDDDLVSLTPVFFRPLFLYADAVPGEVQAAVNDWLSTSPPPSGQTAFFSLDLLLFSTLMPSRQQPLVEFKRLDYALTLAVP